MRVLLTLALLLLSLRAEAQARPEIWYSDLDSAPAAGGPNNGGAFVSLYGAHFGAAREGGEVSVGGVPASGYLLWTDAQITLQIASQAQSGPVVVRLQSGAQSNPLPFTVRKGVLRFVSKAGKDGNPGTYAKPWATLPKAAAALAPGDIAYVLDAVAQPGLDDYNASLAVASSGSPGLPKALVALPGSGASIGSPGGPEYGVRTPAVSGGPFSWWTLAGFALRGRNQALALVGAANWRIVGNDLSCPTGDGNAGCFEAAASSYIRLLGNTVHDVSRPGASKAYHSVYFTTDSNHIEAAWNVIRDNHSCRGIQFHSSPDGADSGYNQYDLHVHHNRISGQACDGINFATVDASRGPVEAYENHIEHVGRGPDPPDGESNYACIASPGITNAGRPGGGTAVFRDNTLCDCGARGGPDAGAFAVGKGSPVVALEGNTVSQHGGEAFLSPASDPDLLRGGGNHWLGGGSIPRKLSALGQSGDEGGACR